MRKLSRDIIAWIDKRSNWFGSWKLDTDLNITTKKDKTLRRVTIKRLCDKGLLIRHPDNLQYPKSPGLYKNIKPPAEIHL